MNSWIIVAKSWKKFWRKWMWRDLPLWSIMEMKQTERLWKGLQGLEGRKIAVPVLLFCFVRYSFKEKWKDLVVVEEEEEERRRRKGGEEKKTSKNGSWCDHFSISSSSFMHNIYSSTNIYWQDHNQCASYQEITLLVKKCGATYYGCVPKKISNRTRWKCDFVGLLNPTK